MDSYAILGLGHNLIGLLTTGIAMRRLASAFLTLWLLFFVPSLIVWGLVVRSGPSGIDRFASVWHWYQRRFAIAHACRFLKQELGWTTPRLRSPLAADCWSWRLASARWQLWLARGQVADARLPWDTAAARDQLGPGRVRRVMAGLLATLGSPARPPRPRGKSPGRQRGQCPGHAPRFPVQRRAPPGPVAAP